MSAPFETLDAMRRKARESIHEGERTAAASRLAFLLKKHGLTEADIDNLARTMHIFAIPAKDDAAAKIAFQVIAKLAPEAYEGLNRRPLMRRKGMDFMEAPMTLAESVDIPAAIEHYINDYREQSEAFLHAYIRGQGLTVYVADPNHPEIPQHTMEEKIDISLKALAVRHNPHHKRLA